MPVSTAQPVVMSKYEARFDPTKVLKHPEFRIIDSDGDPALSDPEANLACAYNPNHEVHMINKPRPIIGPGEALVRVKATGICGSDVHFWKHGHIGPTMIVTDECGAGHESAGQVIEVGAGVSNLKVGDRVAIEAGVPCGMADCEGCRTGRYNACTRVVFFSTPPYHGTLTRFHAHPSAWLHKLPDNVSYEEGSLCEPLAVALAGIERAGLRLGDPILICGAGPIGLVTLLAARAAGCTPIVITDLFQPRLDFAKKLVPSVNTFCITQGVKPEDIGGQIQHLAGGPVKCAMECTGFESSIRSAIYSVGFGGKVFVIGAGPSEQNYPIGYCSANEIDLQFQYRYANQYPKAISLPDAVKAFHTASDPKQGAIKVQIVDQ